MDEQGDFDESPPSATRCPEDCPNLNAPYCPMHEDPAIYRRDDTKLHLQEAYAHNAAREMIYQAIEKLRDRRRLKEVRVPMRQMDEWMVFTRQVVLDSGEHTAQGEIERRVAEWLDRTREQDWDALDRLKERYMRFTPDWKGQSPESSGPPVRGVARPKAPPADQATRKAVKRKRGPADVEADYFEDEF
jgi:hypothetical protein